MAIFREIRNECLIRELERELNTDVLLFGFDGFTYFGRLQAIDDCRIATLTPAIEGQSTDVEILTPGGEVVFVEFARVDLWQIVAKGTGIVTDPFDPPGKQVPSPQDRPETSLELESTVERQESHHLIRLLCKMVGDCVAITTLGGFLFEGVLTTLVDELAILTVNDVFVPGTSTSISDSRLRSVVVNLEVITSVLGRQSCSSR